MIDRTYVNRYQSHQDPDHNPTESELDTDSEFEQAEVREATRMRIQRPTANIPLRRNVSELPSNGPTRFHHETPFYSALIEPGKPLEPHLASTRRRGFQKPIPNFGFIKPIRPKESSLVRRVTIGLVDIHTSLNGSQYSPQENLKRVLTRPSKPGMNDGFDNENCDYILRVNDVLGEARDHQYRVIDMLGQGTFGQVVKCERLSTGELVSVKVIKNKAAYRAQSQIEVEILKQLNQNIEQEDRHRILKLYHTFIHKNHLCLVFELLSFNIYELIRQNSYQGLSANLVRVLTLQLLDSLVLLKKADIIHCDLKPENILLKSPDSPTIKIIDYGSSSNKPSRHVTYIQSRFYRSPEVLLGMQYGHAIDMWSLGCIVAELYLGLPLFPGNSEYNQLARIIEAFGNPPPGMLYRARNTPKLFNKVDKGNGAYSYEFKSREQFAREQGRAELPSKRYLKDISIKDLVMNANNSTIKTNMIKGFREQERDMQVRESLIDFLGGLLAINPLQRWTAQEARHHPFVTGEPYFYPFRPSNYSDRHEFTPDEYDLLTENFSSEDPRKCLEATIAEGVELHNKGIFPVLRRTEAAADAKRLEEEEAFRYELEKKIQASGLRSSHRASLADVEALVSEVKAEAAAKENRIDSTTVEDSRRRTLKGKKKAT
ncbi:kinase-like domain-containing protein [Phycomyces blakesleeanus]|uniref:Kinase-like domain-containing protein n=1 Tax=Phycomyces blakesleeanus TaxID=4837 RepID=A0ABR3BB12_PHYBL